MSSILFWNCRGVQKKGMRNYLCDLINQHNLGQVGLLETKVEDLLRSEVDRLVGRGWEFFYQPVVGKFGGILILCKSKDVLFKLIEGGRSGW
ncbi:hypothetical protein KSP39_PZI014059 [Platanthera zijinensis]|uniref:Uncharacterized protein n=1 Tax=Platanthera zijinensis TaxID=2320716 RepID=A0AAP0BBH4_9ASPA